MRKLLLPMRLDVSSVAKVTLVDGSELPCATEQISRRELVLSCDHDTLIRILPRRCTDPNRPCCVWASFSLPADRGRSPSAAPLIECETTIFAVRRVAQNRFLMHLRFNRLTLRQAAEIESYMEQGKVGG